MRLDEDKLAALRRWGHALRAASGEEQAAAGRAILMLIEENERLRFDLLRTREQWSRDLATGGADRDTDEPLASTLQGRLRQETSGDSEGTESGAGDDRPATSPEAWIESLRRQE